MSWTQYLSMVRWFFNLETLIEQEVKKKWLKTNKKIRYFRINCNYCFRLLFYSRYMFFPFILCPFFTVGSSVVYNISMIHHIFGLFSSFHYNKFKWYEFKNRFFDENKLTFNGKMRVSKPWNPLYICKKCDDNSQIIKKSIYDRLHPEGIWH